MEILRKKSEQNELAFDLLKRQTLYAPAVHCGYYSCFQKIVYILKDYYPDDYKQIETELQGRRKGSLHGSCIRAFVARFKPMCEDVRDAFEFDDFIKQLKNYRNVSDYEDKMITDEEIGKIETMVKKIHQLIKINLSI